MRLVGYSAKIRMLKADKLLYSLGHMFTYALGNLQKVNDLKGYKRTIRTEFTQIKEVNFHAPFPAVAI